MISRQNRLIPASPNRGGERGPGGGGQSGENKCAGHPLHSGEGEAPLIVGHDTLARGEEGGGGLLPPRYKVMSSARRRGRAAVEGGREGGREGGG